MTRYRLIIEYDGAAFVGWQGQRGGGGVQDALSAAIEKFCGERVSVFGAGRTDTGVHARAQVAHVDLHTVASADRLLAGMNFHLKPQPVVIIDAHEAVADFDARFSALARHYQYCIISRRAPLTLDRGRAWFVPQCLDLEAMQAAARYLVGKHDFTTFRSSRCQAKSPVKTLSQLDVERAGACVRVTACAPSFVHHQVRSLVGVLKVVGEGKWTPEDARAALEARDRAACAMVAPAAGLSFVKVDYPPQLLRPPQTDSQADSQAD